MASALAELVTVTALGPRMPRRAWARRLLVSPDKLATLKTVVLALALALALALSGCAATPKAELAFDATGAITVPSGAWDSRYVGSACDGFRGIVDRPIGGDYSDIATGVQVVVKNEAGKTIAVGKLDVGNITDPRELHKMTCTSSFTLTGLLAAKFYSVHVGNSSREDVQFSKAEMKAGPSITLG